MKKKITMIIAICCVFSCTAAISYNYASSFSTSVSDLTSDMEGTQKASIQCDTLSDVDDLSFSAQTMAVPNITFEIPELHTATVNVSDAMASSKTGTKKIKNSYGTFTLVTSDSKIVKYKYGDYDLSKRYLIKGKVEFAEQDVIFDGYFLVKVADSTHSIDRVNMYKGKLTLPNGDVFDGTLNADSNYAGGTQYVSGTYKWTDGRSYKGKFMYNDLTPKNTSNADGENLIGTSAYTDEAPFGYLYFDKNNKNYLYIRFVKGQPYGTGRYVYNGVKYIVKYDKDGVCTYTAKEK